MNNRAAWRDFICATNHPYRHLSSLGASVRGARSEALDVADLADFLQKLRGDQDVELLADMVDLVGGPYAVFFEIALPRLLDRLVNEMESRDEIVGPGLRGNPRWDRTVVGRIAGSLPIGRYHSRIAYRSFALPENLLLRWLVDGVATSVRDLIRRSSSKSPHGTLTSLLKYCDEAMAHHWFSTLPVPAYLTPEMIGAAKRSRLPEYRAAAELAEGRARLKSSAEEDRWYAILMLLAVGWLEPVSDDDLFELYVLTLVLDVLADELGFGEPEEYGLVTSGRKHVAGFRTEAGKLRVIFDQSPAPFASVKTKYKSVVNAYAGVTGNARRPDISIIFDRADGVARRVIVEMKRTASDRYVSDSIYKVFGYLFDFSALWRSDHPSPKAIILIPEGVTRLPGLAFNETAIVSSTDRAALAEALASGLL